MITQNMFLLWYKRKKCLLSNIAWRASTDSRSDGVSILSVETETRNLVLRWMDLLTVKKISSYWEKNKNKQVEISDRKECVQLLPSWWRE